MRKIKKTLLFVFIAMASANLQASSETISGIQEIFGSSTANSWRLQFEYIDPNGSNIVRDGSLIGTALTYDNSHGIPGQASLLGAKHSRLLDNELISGNFEVSTIAHFDGGDPNFVYGLYTSCHQDSSEGLSIINTVRIAIAPGLFRIDTEMGLGETIIDWTSFDKILGFWDRLIIVRSGDTLDFYIQSEHDYWHGLSDTTWEEIYLGSYTQAQNCDYYSVGLFSSENVSSAFTDFALVVDRVVPEVYINTNSQNIYKGENLEVYFNTSVLEGMSDAYNVYFSVGLDDHIFYVDKNKKFVADKEPLYSNVGIPKMDSWFTQLNYYFLDDAPQRDYMLGLTTEDNKGNVISKSFIPVSYYPDDSPFTSVIIEDSDELTTTSFNTPITSTSENTAEEECNLGGIKSKHSGVIELSKATKRAMLVLQMGSNFELEGRLKTAYYAVKGAYNLLSMGEKLCNEIDDLETLFQNHDVYIDISSITDEQAANLFVIDLLESALSLTKRGAVLYSSFEKQNLIDGIKDYYQRINSDFAFTSSLNNTAESLYINLKQPCVIEKKGVAGLFCGADAAYFNITAVPIFTYKPNNEGIPLENIEKTYTNFTDIESKTIDIGKVRSNTNFNIGSNILDLTRGLYLIKAVSEDGEEVFRSTFHAISNGQTFTMKIER